MINIVNILKGWENFIEKSEVVEEIAKNRAEKCSVCPFAKSSKLLVFLNDEIEEVQGFKCSKCKCPLSAKIRSLNEKCPIGNW